MAELENSSIPILRPPWAKIGWLGEALDWIDEQLATLEYEQIATVAYVRNWSISCVLKIKISRETIYFKEASTCSPLFCNEPTVTKTLASVFPKHMPTLMAINVQRHWMLLTDFGKPIGNSISFEVKKNIYCLFANIQIQAIQQRDHLLSIGCIDRRLDILQSQIEPLMNDDVALSELSASEIERLHALAPRLQDLCLQLASYKIPETLVHGDLHLHNVARYRDNYLFFDWTDSCIAHPFFDFVEFILSNKQKSFLGRMKGLWQQKTKKRLRDQYLHQWGQYESRERLLDAWNIAKPLCLLHHAVTYQHMIHSLEARTKQEISCALPYLLREIITSV